MIATSNDGKLLTYNGRCYIELPEQLTGEDAVVVHKKRMPHLRGVEDQVVADLLVTCCYFPNVGEIEITFERVGTTADLEDQLANQVMITAKVKLSDEEAQHLVEIIGPCVYHKAARRK